MNRSKKVFNRFLISFLIFVMLFYNFNILFLAQEPAFSGGDGLAKNPYKIATKEDLNNVRYNLDCHFLMINDIEFAEDDFKEGGIFFNGGNGWEPIGGREDNPFTGSFCGGGYKIVGLKILESDFGGLFAYNRGDISHLCMKDTFIHAKNYAGGIVAYNTGDISCVSIKDSSIKAKEYAGGIVAWNVGNISNSYNLGEVTSDRFAGGIVAFNKGKVFNTYNQGEVFGENVAGGIVCNNAGDAKISNVYNTGNIYNSHPPECKGAIAGQVDNSLNIENYYYLKTDGIKGFPDEGSNTYGKTEEEMASQSTYNNFDFDEIWEFSDHESYDFPQLISNRQIRVKNISLKDCNEDIETVEGCEPDIENLCLLIEYEDGYGVKKKITNGFTLHYDTDKVGKQGVSITYKGDFYPDVFFIEVIKKAVEKLEVIKEPDKTIYFEGDSFEPEGMIVIAFYNDGSSEPITDYSFTKDNLKLGQDFVIIYYEGKDYNIEIEVKAKKEPGDENENSSEKDDPTTNPDDEISEDGDDSIEKRLVSLEIKNPPNKTNYIEGEIFDGKGLVLLANYDNGKSEPIIEGFTLPSQVLIVGQKYITISFEDKPVNVNINVRPKELLYLKLTYAPSKTKYIEGEVFNPDGMVITAFYNNGTSEPIVGYLIKDYKIKPEQSSILVLYEGHEILVEIEVTPIRLEPLTGDFLISDSIISNIKTNMTVGEFKRLFKNSEYIRIFKEKTEILDNQKVGTGMTLFFTAGEEDATYSLVVKYDINGDGQISSSDARLCLRAAAKLEKLTKEQEMAAKTKKDAKLSASCARLILRVSAKLEPLPV